MRACCPAPPTPEGNSLLTLFLPKRQQSDFPHLVRGERPQELASLLVCACLPLWTQCSWPEYTSSCESWGVSGKPLRLKREVAIFAPRSQRAVVRRAFSQKRFPDPKRSAKRALAWASVAANTSGTAVTSRKSRDATKYSRSETNPGTEDCF